MIINIIGAKGAFMYGPKSMQPKNVDVNMNTNSIRLEPLDVTSIHIMKSLDRGNSAPASLTNNMGSLQSIGNFNINNITIILILILTL